MNKNIFETQVEVIIGFVRTRTKAAAISIGSEVAEETLVKKGKN